MKLYYFIVICVLFYFSIIQSAEIPRAKFKKFSSAGSFYSQGFGAVAFMPPLGSDRYIDSVSTHEMMYESGKIYEISKTGDNCYFRVNHLQAGSDVSYLGVTVTLFYDGKRPVNPLRLSRNKTEWFRDRNMDKLLNGPRLPHTSINDYLAAHNFENVKDADEKLTFTWHAAVKPGAPHSWDYRKKWSDIFPSRPDPFLRAIKLDKESYSTELTARIIQFTTGQGGFRKGKTLFFGFNKSGAAGAYLRIFSPLGIDKHFYLVFK